MGERGGVFFLGEGDAGLKSFLEWSSSLVYFVTSFQGRLKARSLTPCFIGL